jgi:hypothetical protein
MPIEEQIKQNVGCTHSGNLYSHKKWSMKACYGTWFFNVDWWKQDEKQVPYDSIHMNYLK